MKKFVWGKIIERFNYDFEDNSIEIIKFHPWLIDGHTLLTGKPNCKQVLYHCELLHESFNSLYAAIIGYIVYDKLGMNQYALVSGICRALNIDQSSLVTDAIT